MALSTKQKAFINEYLRNGFNGTQAALTAGYAQSSARVQARRLITNDNVKAEIARRLAENTIRANEALQRLSDQAMGDLGDYIDSDGHLDMGRVREDGKTYLIREFDQWEKFDDKSETRITQTRIKLYDAQSALKEIIKLYRLDEDKPTENQSLKVHVEYADYNPKTTPPA